MGAAKSAILLTFYQIGVQTLLNRLKQSIATAKVGPSLADYPVMETDGFHRSSLSF